MTQVTREQLASLPADVQAYIAGLAAKAAANVGRVTLKVTEAKRDDKTGAMKGSTGAIAMYGLGRFPVTLYRSQWEKLIEAVKSGQVERFIEANASLLSVKE